MKRLLLVSAARRELHRAARRYEASRPGLGGEFLAAVGDLLHRVAREAGTFPRWREDRPYRKAVMVRRFPFVVFFQEYDAEVRVFAIAHGKRRPGYWLRRR